VHGRSDGNAHARTSQETQRARDFVERRVKTLVVGIGSLIPLDDILAVRVVQTLRHRFDEQQVTVLGSNQTSLDVLDTVDLLADHKKVVVIAIVQAGQGNAAEECRLSSADPDAIASTILPYHTSFGAALRLGKRLGIALPQEMVFLPIKVANATFSERCQLEVEHAIQVAADVVNRELENASFP